MTHNESPSGRQAATLRHSAIQSACRGAAIHLTLITMNLNYLRRRNRVISVA
jgi:hypothetical protein